MIGPQNKREAEERLDRVGRALVGASAANEAEAEAVASSPFLYARLRHAVEAARDRREAGENWLALLGVVWRSAPAMALVAAFAFVLFWTTSFQTQPALFLGDETLLSERDAGVEHVVFADRSPLSNDEVLATILSEDEREASR